MQIYIMQTYIIHASYLYMCPHKSTHNYMIVYLQIKKCLF